MSLKDLFGKGIKFITGDSIGASVVRTIGAGLAVKKLYQSSQKDNNIDTAESETPDYGVREQVSADPTTKVPVVYGDAFIGGKLVDARMTNNNQTMWYCMALCEVTGNNIAGTASTFQIEDVYWNNSRMTFQSHTASTNDAYTANTLVDRNGKVDDSIKGLVQVFVFNGKSGSTSQLLAINNTSQTGAVDTGGSAVNYGYNLFPQWTSTDLMTDLIYVLVKVDYNKEKNISGLAEMKFHIKNSLKAPGDVLYDYMTNSRYGAGIAAGDINVS